MKIYGIDVNPATRAQKTGTEWYAFHLIEAMKKTPLAADERVILYSAAPLEGALAELPTGWTSHVLHSPFKRGWTQLRLSFEMLRRPPSVLFVPAHAVPRLHPKQTVTTIHDVGFKRFPQLYESKPRRYLASTTAFAVKHCKKLITPSVFTKQEVMTLYHVADEKIVVTPLAPGQTTLSDNRREPLLPSRNVIGSHYFLTVSRIESKKNIATLIRAFELFKEHRGIGDPFQLVLVGKPGFGYERIKMLIDRSPQKGSIHELGWVVEGEVPVLMQKAFGYVYPSWYEGLGISALEAMAAGVPLIASNIPALHEAAGDAAMYFTPNAPEELAREMTRLVEETSTRENMIALGKARVAQFTWEKTAELTWAVLHSML